MAGIKIYFWKAVHRSGTKFYQVIRFISDNGQSFSLRQNGPIAIFVEIGKMATGTIELDESKLDSDSGFKKINDKTDDGYSTRVESKSMRFSSSRDTVVWARNSFGKKALDITTAIVNSPSWISNIVVDETAPAAQIADRLPEIRSEQWGSW